ncbi:MAG: hypothetical protein FJ276_33295, partial [Planctomycetes bacterium]|nr:hypothetical protein [Planctomycetota bacterium]
MSVLAVVLGAAVVMSAVWAGREARAKHRIRAIALNLFGIACLALGFVALWSWSNGKGSALIGPIVAAGESPGARTLKADPEGPAANHSA